MGKNERWQALLLKIKELRCGGKAAELARRIGGRNPTYINRLFYPAGKDGAKGIGLDIMEACNAAFDLPRGFWDMEPDEAAAILSGEAPAPGPARKVFVSSHGDETTLAALKALISACERADALTAAQVKPLFAMLFTGADPGTLDPGTIAQRLAELLAGSADAQVRADDLHPKKAASRVDIVLNPEDKKDGSSDSAAANKRKARRG